MHLTHNSSFSRYVMSDKEALEGAVLTSLQKASIQNQLAAVAEEKIYLEYDVSTPETFMQQEAYKRGQLDILRYLLDASETAEQELYHTTPILDEE